MPVLKDPGIFAIWSAGVVVGEGEGGESEGVADCVRPRVVVMVMRVVIVMMDAIVRMWLREKQAALGGKHDLPSTSLLSRFVPAEFVLCTSTLRL